MRTLSPDFTRLSNVSLAAFPPHVPSDAIAATMLLLVESRQLAIDVGNDPWQFAVEMSELQQLSLSRSELRWLLSRQFVLHAHEITSASDKSRSFSCFDGAVLGADSCFVITEVGLSQIAQQHEPNGRLAIATLDALASVPFRFGALGGTRMPVVGTPSYDSAGAKLLVSGQVVKQFRRAAPNQQIVLRAFEESAWSQRIDDPLPPGGEVCAKRRLNETIKALNSHRLQPLVRFLGDGTGEGVRWKYDV